MYIKLLLLPIIWFIVSVKKRAAKNLHKMTMLKVLEKPSRIWKAKSLYVDHSQVEFSLRLFVIHWEIYKSSCRKSKNVLKLSKKAMISSRFAAKIWNSLEQEEVRA